MAKRHFGATKYDFDFGYMPVGHTHNHLIFLEQQTKWTNDVRNFLETADNVMKSYKCKCQERSLHCAMGPSKSAADRVAK